jgi:hypothetical protein
LFLPEDNLEDIPNPPAPHNDSDDELENFLKNQALVRAAEGPETIAPPNESTINYNEETKGPWDQRRPKVVL